MDHPFRICLENIGTVLNSRRNRDLIKK